MQGTLSCPASFCSAGEGREGYVFFLVFFFSRARQDRAGDRVGCKKVALCPPLIQNILRSYSSSYWLNQKQWFIAIEWNQRLIHSVPRYSCELADSNLRPFSHCTAPDQSLFYNHINALAVWGHITDRFPNVKELWLVDDPLIIQLKNLIDINRVERLIFVSSKIDLFFETFVDLIEKMKNFNSIQF